MPKVTAITKLVAKPGRFDALLQAADRMVAAVRDEPGTEIYTISRATSAEQTLFIYEEFTDRAAFKAHAAAGAAVGGLLTPLVMTAETLLGEPLVSKSP